MKNHIFCIDLHFLKHPVSEELSTEFNEILSCQITQHAAFLPFWIKNMGVSVSSSDLSLDGVYSIYMTNARSIRNKNKGRVAATGS